jgi:hypothetical protein
MTATLKIINNATLTSDGLTLIGKQGATTDAITDSFSITTVTISGTAHSRFGSIATATYNTIYNAANDFPATGDYLFFWADQDVYLQFIGSASNFIVKVLATVPFVLPGFNKHLAAVSTTVFSAEPTLEALAKVVVGNVSGTTANYFLMIVN